MNKTVVITGTNRGIGLETANIFLNNGWKVIGTYHNEKSEIKHHKFNEVQLDLAEPKSIENAVKEIVALSTSIDVLINNAGVQLEKLSDTNIHIIRKVFEVNLFGLIDFTEQLLKLISRKGQIINISSRKSSMHCPIDKDVLSGYRMSKSALNMYTRTLAYRLADTGIVVSAFNPGWVKTSMGYSIATDVSEPERNAKEVAKELYDLANESNLESGIFWHKGEVAKY